jgi:hypothetical protein
LLSSSVPEFDKFWQKRISKIILRALAPMVHFPGLFDGSKTFIQPVSGIVFEPIINYSKHFGQTKKHDFGRQ